MTAKEAEAIRAEAIANLNKAATRNKALLLEVDPHNAKLIWAPYQFGMETKVGKGWLRVAYAEHYPTAEYPGIHYTSSMGANSDDSYGGFLPGVSFDEALLIVYRDYKRNTR